MYPEMQSATTDTRAVVIFSHVASTRTAESAPDVVTADEAICAILNCLSVAPQPSAIFSCVLCV